MSTTREDLTKLTVAQLKLLCKVKRLSGYSKLPKPGIIQKLIEHDNKTATQLPSNPEVLPLLTPKAEKLGSTTSTKGMGNVSDLAQALSSEAPGSPCSACSVPTINALNELPIPHNKGRDLSGLSRGIRPSITALPSKRTSEPPDFHIRALTKKTRLDNSPMTQIQVHQITDEQPMTMTIRKYPSNLPRPPSDPLNLYQGTKLSSNTQSHSTPTIKIEPKHRRFIPLTIIKPVPLHAPQPHNINNSVLDCRFQSLDFDAFTMVPLQLISLPPSLSQRKHVARLALFLCSVATEDLKICAQVSRLFRYAAYISAFHRLKRDFPGQRLDLLLQEYSPNMTNMWPYLRKRQDELAERKSRYHSSFLAQALGENYKISELLWASPDHERQITIAVRFLLTCLFFTVSVGGTDGQPPVTVTDAREIVPGEVWSITIHTPSSAKVFHVLEATCEVIGRPPQLLPVRGTAIIEDPHPLRADWSAYVNKANTIPLLSHLKWTNHEEYERGISKLWLEKIHSEGEGAKVKQVIAERYILACVVSNSVSGSWMSSIDMASEFSSNPSTIMNPRQAARVQLFLPEHHHVESLHLMISKNIPLHPALALVQTPRREYYILRDNGMQVGSEEEGVARVWMELLHCDASGRLV